MVKRCQDLAWWFRDQMQALNVSTWNMPRVSIFRSPIVGPHRPPGSTAIIEGDMLHVDFGLTLLGLNTDMQHLGYVLRVTEGEKDVPQGLKEGLKQSNRMQELVRTTMKPGNTGNEILKECLRKMKTEQIEGQVVSHRCTACYGKHVELILLQYCHPIGALPCTP